MPADDLTLREAERYLNGPALQQWHRLCARIRLERGRRRRDTLRRLQARIDREAEGA